MLGFSWKTADTKLPIPCLGAVKELKHEHPTVYLLQPDGNHVCEPFYEGKGKFNGVDVYEWLALMNLSPLQISKKMSHGETLRIMGITLEFEKKPIKYPLKFSFDKKAVYSKLPVSEPDTDEGVFFSKEDIKRLKRVMFDLRRMSNKANKGKLKFKRSKIMSLKDFKKKTGKQKKMEPVYGVVLDVMTSKANDDGTVSLKGTVLNSTAFARAGEVVNVVANHPKSADNMKRGGAKFENDADNAGTILSLEGCKNTGMVDNTRTLSSRYVTTISSPHKTHKSEQGFVSTLSAPPILRFPNVNQQKGEGKVISYALNTGKYGDKDMDWVRTKLAEAEEAGRKSSVSTDTISPSHAVLFESMDELRKIAEDHCDNNNKFLLLRASDDQGEVFIKRLQIFQTKNENGNYHLDYDKTFAHMAEKGIFRGVDASAQDDLFDGIKDGSLPYTLEAIPGEKLWFAADTQKSIVQRNLIEPLPPAKEGDDPRIPLSFIYGDSRYPFTNVVLPCATFEDGNKMLLNVFREAPGHQNISQLPTSILPNGVQKIDTPTNDLTDEDISAPADSEDETFDLGEDSPAPGM